MTNDKEYLGDAVNISHDGYHVVLQTGHNVIYLEPGLLDAIPAYYKRIQEKYKENKND